MTITITKNDFEAALPIGTAAHDDVFESIKPEIGKYLAFANDSLLGVAGQKRIEELGEDSQLLSWYKQLVCLAAFIASLRQLDLVLTSTGFGVVSNNNLAPASKQRVDALESALRTQYYRVLAMTLNLLRCDTWGATAQALHFVGHVYDEYTFFFDTHQGASSTDWLAYRQNIEDAEELLREKISDEQMDDILDAFRRGDPNRLEPYREVISLIVKFTDAWAQKGMDVLRQPVYRRLMNTLESEDNQEYFKLYLQSDAYKANHYEPYRNTKDSTAYIFNG